MPEVFGNGGREGRCDGSKKNSPASTGLATPDQMQGEKRQLKEMERRTRAGRATRGPHGLHSQSRCFFLGPMISWVVALHTVLDTAEPVTLCWAAVIRSVRLWPDIAAAPPPPSRSAAGGDRDPQAPEGPHPPPHPLPHGSLPACRPGAGLRAACCHPAGGEAARVPPRGLTRCRALPCPRLSSAHPFLGQLEPGRARGTGSCRKMAAPDSSSSFPGCPRVT